MELTDRIAALEDEINVLKTEVKTVLVDIRDQLMKPKSPFGNAAETRAASPFEPGHEHEEHHEHGLRVVRLPSADEPEDTGFAQAEAPAQRPATAPAAPAAPAAAAPGGPGDLLSRLGKLPSRHAGPAPAPGVPREWGVLDIASMGKWAEAATRRVGRRRLEELLGVYSLLTGEPQESARDALLKMLDLCGATHEPQNVSMNDVVTVLSQLDALFRSNSITEVTVLSLLSDAA